MQLFYNKNLTEQDKELTFDKVESRHIVRVLRKKKGDPIFITNGNGLLFEANISLASDKKCVANISTLEIKNKPRDYSLQVAIAPTKSNDRFEWFLEKATEIGIDTITPIICDHSERKTVKLDRMQKIVESAAKQSLKYHFPLFNDPIGFKKFLSTPYQGQKFIAHCKEDAMKKPLKTSVSEENEILILIGPEGDFSSAEIELARSKGFISVSLGESRLRTETAGIAAVHTIAILQ